MYRLSVLFQGLRLSGKSILPLLILIGVPLFGYAATSSANIEQRASFIMKSIELKEKRDNLQGSDAIIYYQTLRQIYAGVLSKVEEKIASIQNSGMMTPNPVTPMPAPIPTPVVTTPAPTIVSVSPDGTTIPSATQIVDANRSVWTVTDGVIYKDARLAGYSRAVTKLVYRNSIVYQQNTAGNWWSWNGTTWVSTSNPLGTSTPTPVVTTPVTPTPSPVNPTPVTPTPVIGNTYTLTIGTPLANGRIIGEGINCPGDCTETYTVGRTIRLTAVPDTGYVVNYWYGSCQGTASTCDRTMDHNPWVSVNFKASIASPSPTTPATPAPTPTPVNPTPTPTPNFGSRTIRIMPLGDSITGGYWYRLPLWQKLKGNGYNVDFVGRNNDGDTANDGDHNGNGGYVVQDVLNPAGNGPIQGTYMARYKDSRDLAYWFTTPADIVLMHFGTNDSWGGVDDAGANRILQSYSAILQAARTANPNVVFMVAQILPMKTNGSIVNLNPLNSKIPTWALQNSTSQSPIIVVDQNSGFDVNTMTTDGVHPNDVGGNMMANRWYDAIASYLRK